jgi:hypothetical protein
MKKILFCLVLLPFLLSCSSDKEEIENPINPVVGTKWASNSGDNDADVLEFITNTTFLEYNIDENENIISSLGCDEGTYKYENGEIIFLKQDFINEMNKATVNGNILTLYYKSGTKRLYTKK